MGAWWLLDGWALLYATAPGCFFSYFNPPSVTIGSDAAAPTHQDYWNRDTAVDRAEDPLPWPASPHLLPRYPCSWYFAEAVLDHWPEFLVTKLVEAFEDDEVPELIARSRAR